MSRLRACFQCLYRSEQIFWRNTQSLVRNTSQRAISTSFIKMEKLKGNPYFDKYAEKLKSMEKSDPEQFKLKIAAMEEAKRKEQEELKKSMEEEKAQQIARAKQIKEQGLDAIMKIELLKDKTAEEIEHIWTEHHSKKDVIFSVIPKEEYCEISSKSTEFPTFIYPLPRAQGYEFVLQQFTGNTVVFTPLIQYQVHKENAPACMTMTHYTEFMDDKGVVLMVGEPDLNILSVYEAQLLALQVKMYYGLNAGLKFNYVRQLNNSPDTFKHNHLIKQFQYYMSDLKETKEWKN